MVIVEWGKGALLLALLPSIWLGYSCSVLVWSKASAPPLAYQQRGLFLLDQTSCDPVQGLEEWMGATSPSITTVPYHASHTRHDQSQARFQLPPRPPLAWLCDTLIPNKKSTISHFTWAACVPDTSKLLSAVTQMPQMAAGFHVHKQDSFQLPLVTTLMTGCHMSLNHKQYGHEPQLLCQPEPQAANTIMGVGAAGTV